MGSRQVATWPRLTPRDEWSLLNDGRDSRGFKTCLEVVGDNLLGDPRLTLSLCLRLVTGWTAECLGRSYKVKRTRASVGNVVFLCVFFFVPVASRNK